MGERSEYAPGEFCWVDAGLPDMVAGSGFYTGLMGWHWEPGGEETGGYGIFSRDGKAVAGLGPTQSPDQPPAWGGYVSVEDADATAARVKEAGGTVMTEPFDVLEAGRMAVCQDPQGAVFCIWQANQMHGSVLVNEPGSWIWNELISPDVKGVEGFYADVFGWSLAGSDEGGTEYYAWQAAGQKWEEGVAGARPIADYDLPAGTPPQWLVYLAVPDAEAAVKATTDAGGKQLVAPLEIPVGTMAVLSDPQGAVFGVLEPDFPEER